MADAQFYRTVLFSDLQTGDIVRHLGLVLDRKDEKDYVTHKFASHHVLTRRDADITAEVRIEESNASSTQ